MVTSLSEQEKPVPGNLSFCNTCGEVSIFTETMGLRKPTDKEILDIYTSPQWPAFEKIIKHITEKNK